jgi:hypothetical protein
MPSSHGAGASRLRRACIETPTPGAETLRPASASGAAGRTGSQMPDAWHALQLPALLCNLPVHQRLTGTRTHDNCHRAATARLLQVAGRAARQPAGQPASDPVFRICFPLASPLALRGLVVHGGIHGTLQAPRQRGGGSPHPSARAGTQHHSQAAGQRVTQLPSPSACVQ